MVGWSGMPPTPATPNRPDRYFTVEETAAILRCSTDTIYRHIKLGTQAAIRPFGRRFLIPASSLPSAGASPHGPDLGDSTPPNLSAFADDLTN